jgi:UDP-N-acetylmuramate: L-alanyl-gamma-D-glutamyl-meso-diaminopimelate ligase
LNHSHNPLQGIDPTSTTPVPALSPEQNVIPQRFRHVHLMGICGTGMASLAGMLKKMGYHVTGSDQNVYPPMSDLLRNLSIPVMAGYDAKNLVVSPDLVVVGNVITRQNPEAIALARMGLPYLSFPQAIRHFAIGDKRAIVISGTHGKTTTSSMVAWLLERGGLEPAFMIGGIPNNFGVNFRLSAGNYFVVEGDEYDTAFFDKGPKFLHYHPWTVVLTGVEYDHADIYRDLHHVKESFRKLIRLIPQDGLLIFNADDPVATELARDAVCPMTRYSMEGRGDWNGSFETDEASSVHLKVSNQGKEVFGLQTLLYGRHNLSNLLAAVAVARFLEVPPGTIAGAAETLQGAKRRQEVLGERRGILVIDDFAHHPTAVRETIAAVSDRYRERRLLAVFEPRSNSSRRAVFQEQYGQAFDRAEVILIPEPPMMEKIPIEERFSSARLVEDLKKRGRHALYFDSTDRLLETLLRLASAGDVVLFMSNGGFDNLPRRLMDSL